MIAGVSDTHTALWYLTKHPKLSASARNFIDSAAATGLDIVLSPISLAEIVYLAEKGRVASSLYSELRRALADPDFVIQEAPFHAEIVEAMRTVPRDDIPDMPDRIIASTAVYLRVLVISREGRIRGGALETVW